jgi:glycosyltransferase involved in cell wall biosynthesis
MRICLFDWNAIGHNPLILKSFAEALTPDAEVTLAAPDLALERVGLAGVETRPLGDPRPQPSSAKGKFSRDGQLLDKAEVAREELELIDSVCADARPDHLVIMHGDPLLRWLVRRAPFPFPHSIIVFQARVHYPSAYSTPLPLGERLRAHYQDHLVKRWQRRPDAHAVFALDRIAAERWSHRRGAEARWLPEPPIPVPLPSTDVPRAGCIFFGLLAARKGLGLVADALSEDADGFQLTVAGEIAPGYAEELTAEIARLRKHGVEVNERTGRLSDEEAMRELASARCAVIPYRFHPGTSRVLTEAAAVGTPVIAPDHGLVGHLTREYGIGLTADPTDRVALREALLQLERDPGGAARYRPNLERYTREYGGNAFRKAVRATFGLDA